MTNRALTRLSGVTTEQVIYAAPCRLIGVLPELLTTGTIKLRDDSVAAPVIPTTPAAVAAAGGSLADATYYAKIVAVDKYGEFSLPSTEVSATTATTNNSVTFTWDAMDNAVSYRIFFGTVSGTLPKYFEATAATYTLTTTTGQLTATIPATATAGNNQLKAQCAIGLLQAGKFFGSAVFHKGLTAQLSVGTDISAIVWEAM